MAETISFLVEHGYIILFAWVMAEQMGLPLPAAPFLIAAGALSGSDQMNFYLSVIVGVLGALLSDFFWFQMGRRVGSPMLSGICRIALEPDSCVRRTENIFSRHGEHTLLITKFIPGLNAVATPLAGIIHMNPWRFLFFDTLGAIFWVVSYAGLGYIFSEELDYLASYVLGLGNTFFILIAAVLSAYVLRKYIRRRRFLRDVQFARISPEELKGKIDRGEGVVVVDVRHALDFEADPEVIPGALRLPLESPETDDRIPRDRDVVLYCTCPNEASSAQVAQILRLRGITRVKALAGGLNAWRKRGFPIEVLSPDTRR